MANIISHSHFVHVAFPQMVCNKKSLGTTAIKQKFGKF